MPGKPWTLQEEARLLGFVKSGLKALAVARRLGRTRHAVYFHVCQMRREGKIPPAVMPRRRKAGELAARLRKLCAPGVPDSAVAAILGISPGTVQRTRSRLGIPRGLPEGRKLPKTPQRWEYEQYGLAAFVTRCYGYSDELVAETAGLKWPQSVYQTRKRLGIPSVHSKKKEGDRCEDRPPRILTPIRIFRPT